MPGPCPEWGSQRWAGMSPASVGIVTDVLMAPSCCCPGAASEGVAPGAVTPETFELAVDPRRAARGKPQTHKNGCPYTFTSDRIGGFMGSLGPSEAPSSEVE